MERLIGLKVKVNDKDKRTVRRREGIISEATRTMIVVQFKHYRESYNLAAIITEDSENIDIRIDNEWIKLKEVLKYGQNRG